MYYAAPGVGKGVFKLLAKEKTYLIFEKKMYTVNNNV
jgi:hypothetical protein